MDDCPICLDNYNYPTLTLPCSHKYCYTCIKYTHRTSCCICRRDFSWSDSRIQDQTKIVINSLVDFCKSLHIDKFWVYESRTPGKWWMFSLNDIKELNNSPKQILIDGTIYNIVKRNGKIYQKNKYNNIEREISMIDLNNLNSEDDIIGIAGVLFERSN